MTKIKEENCPKCGEKKFHLVDNMPTIERAILHLKIGDKRCELCGYVERMKMV